MSLQAVNGCLSRLPDVAAQSWPISSRSPTALQPAVIPNESEAPMYRIVFIELMARSVDVPLLRAPSRMNYVSKV